MGICSDPSVDEVFVMGFDDCYDPHHISFGRGLLFTIFGAQYCHLVIGHKFSQTQCLKLALTNRNCTDVDLQSDQNPSKRL